MKDSDSRENKNTIYENIVTHSEWCWNMFNINKCKYGQEGAGIFNEHELKIHLYIL